MKAVLRMWAVVLSVIVSFALLVAIYFSIATLFVGPEAAGLIFIGLGCLAVAVYASWLVYDNERWQRR